MNFFIATIGWMSKQNNHSSNNLRFAFWTNLLFALLELVGGFYVNSVAIMSDALHDFGDSISLGTAWYLDKRSKHKADKSFSFGYARHSLLGALINSIILIAGSSYVFYEAVHRIIEPEMSDASGMIIFALIGILVNGVVAFRMSKGESMNEKVVYWHILEDVLGWVAVLIGGIILYFYKSPYIDPILSILITTYILWGVAKRLIETMHFFLQGVPKNINIEEILSEIHRLPNVADTHHTHSWSLDGSQHVFSTHVKLKEIHEFSELKSVKESIKDVLKNNQFTHYTIEVELDDETCDLKD